MPYDDPMSKVLGLDAKTSGLGAWSGFTSGSTVLLVGLMALASVVAWMHAAQARRVDGAAGGDRGHEGGHAASAAARHRGTGGEARAAPLLRLARAATRPPPPPPAPAQAAKVLTQEPDPNEPVDLTGNTIVQGNADAYAGGFTAEQRDERERGATACRRRRAFRGGTGAPAGPPTPDRSSGASLPAGGRVELPLPARSRHRPDRTKRT